jgi:hypothetical protein
MLANTVGRQYTGVPGVYLVPEPAGNWVLISAPAELFDEIMKTLKALDRAPPSIAVEVAIVEFPRPVKEKEAGKEREKGIRAADFEGPAEKIGEKLQKLEKSGQVQRLKRFQLKAVNNQIAQVQDNEDEPGAQAAAAPAGFPGRGAIPFSATGTRIQLTARAAEDCGVLMELSVHDSPRSAAHSETEADAKDEAGANAEEKPDSLASKFLGTLAIPPGQAVVASEIERNTSAGSSRVLIIVTAKVIEAEPDMLPEDVR